ncbi:MULTISPECIES: DUF6928 family protein [Thermomonosporaceae]|uniref:DUF6928 family protein n=1 Tax=Thermomonosporaceae TaxID=2012 RepID=UPI00255AE943|nr:MULTISPECIES: hypothetical protein [Thermomonosporaceae]MDL4773636.1 hypothetical protein [Actinomadura xylanilytica]
MGAKTGLLVYADRDIKEALRAASVADPEQTAVLIEDLYPGWAVREAEPSSLGDGCYPRYGTTYAARLPGVDIICDQRVMSDRPSQLAPHLVEASIGRRLVLHAMHSVVDWLAFAVWEDGHLIRSLSLSPDSGVMENIGEPLPFEAAYWAGEHPVPHDPDWSDEPYPLPFHPLDLGEDALRALLGFILEGMPEPDDADPNDVGLLGFRLTDPSDPDEVSERDATINEAVRTMGPPRLFTFAPDGSPTEIDSL